ncbi:MAG TPA: DUF2849 domain-containing protein [Alphaproteobacteria bacterium]|nr:DUF2849 domain-containing protein [Alphaproteobacteria bacterium]
MSTRALVANRLADGRVVYRAESGWTSDLQNARLACDEAAASVLLEEGRRAVAERMVVDPYLIDVVAKGGVWQPARLRERIRSRGPTIRADLGYQAGEVA